MFGYGVTPDMTDEELAQKDLKQLMDEIQKLHGVIRDFVAAFKDPNPDPEALTFHSAVYIKPLSNSERLRREATIIEEQSKAWRVANKVVNG